MSWRLGMGLAAGHERVRVARALPELPATAAAFAAGRLSWTQVRATTRVAEPGDEATYVNVARHASGAQLERLARGVRRARQVEQDARDPAAGWRLRTRVCYRQDGSMVISARLPAEQGALMLAALEAARAAIDHDHQATTRPPPVRPGRSVRGGHRRRGRTASPPGGGQPSSAEDPADRPIPAEPEPEPGRPVNGDRTSDADADADSMVDADTDSTVGSPVCLDCGPGGQLGSGTAGRAGCGELSSAEEAAEAAVARADRPVAKGATRSEGLLRLAQHFLDRSSREHRPAGRRSPAQLTAQIDPLSGWARLPDGELLPPVCTRVLRRALTGRGGRLRLRRLSAADLASPMWSAGGATDLANLILLCARHHSLVHADGYQLSLHPDRRLTVATRDGLPIPHHPPSPWRPAAELDPDHKIGPDTLPPNAADARLNLGYAVSVLLQHAA